MPSAIEFAGLAGFGLAIGGLFGAWWGVLTGSLTAVVYGNALGGRQ